MFQLLLYENYNIYTNTLQVNLKLIEKVIFLNINLQVYY